MTRDPQLFSFGKDNMLVTKRSGVKEELNIEKIHKVASWACDGITNVSVSELEIKSQIQFYPDIKTSDIQETMIKSAADLITEETPNYQYVAGRLVNYHLRKSVYGTFKPTRLYDHVKKLVDLGMYTSELLDWYTEAEFDIIESDILDHSRDFMITYAGMEQFRGKYLVKNRVTDTILETPQMSFILISMVLFHSYKTDRLKWITEYYDAISQFDISLPTPIMAGVRTVTKQFSSCVLIESDDSLDSMNAAASAVVKYVSKRAGIGLGLGKIRAIGSPIRKGDSTHTGVIPFIKYFQAAVKSCSQGGIRGGSATAYFPCWHYEIEDILVLKNNKGTENNRARNLDYGIQFNKVMYERLLSGGNITLFSPSDVPGLYDLFFVDTDEFRTLYEKYEADTSIRKKVIPAIQLFSMFLQERKDTGRIYLMNVDHVNDHGAFDKKMSPIRMSNLCVSGNTIITIMNLDGDLEDIQIKELQNRNGDKVYSRNVLSGKDSFQSIINFAKTGIDRKVMKITDEETGNYVVCTPEHKIYTKNRGYVEAKELKSDDILHIQEG